MRASFPPFGKLAEVEPSAYAADAKPVPTGPISDREADLRTLKHYLYHAVLLVEKLIAAEASGITTVYDSGPREVAADFTRDRDATGA